MDNPIDFGPSELRLLEIGALQERVRMLEAGMNDTLHPDDVRAAEAAYANAWYDHRKSPFDCMLAAIIAYRRRQRARALSEMAAADAELLP